MQSNSTANDDACITRRYMKSTLYSIQVLRGIAATMVVVLHSYNHLVVRNHIPKIPALVDIGRAGVDIFFVISGFIMVYISRESFGAKGGSQDFLMRRIIRVVPIYWIYSLLTAAFLFFAPQLFSMGKLFDPVHMAASFLFIPWENGIGNIKPILSAGWTLNFEMYFYAIFAVLLFGSKRYFLPLLAVIFLSGYVAGLVFAPTPPIFDVITSPMLFEFLMGCIIGTLYMRSEFVLSGYLCVILVIVSVLAMIMPVILGVGDITRVIKWGIPGAFLVAGAVFLEKSTSVSFHPLLTKLGNSSYTLYLTHTIIIGAVMKIWTLAVGEMYEVSIVVAILAALISGYIAYLIIEKPLTTYLNKKYTAMKADSLNFTS